MHKLKIRNFLNEITEKSVSRWLTEWWLVFVLLGVDTTLGDGCGIWQHIHSFREVECLQGYSKTVLMGI